MKKAYLIIFLIVISSLVIFPIGISAYSPYSKIFQEDFSYGYKLQTTSDDKDSISYSRFHFHYYEPFFLDSDNLAAFYKLSNGLISAGIKKWDLNDYNLALGLKFEQINMFNLNAENFEPYHFNESAAFEGNYSQWTLFSEWILSEKERLDLVYQNRSNNYSKNSSTPVNYTVPQDNMVHSISGEYIWISPMRHHHKQVKRLKLLYGFSDSSSYFGLNSSHKQFEKLYLIEGHWFTPVIVQENGSVLIGISGLLSVDSQTRIGNPTLWDNPYSFRIYGFSQNELGVNNAIALRADYTQTNFLLQKLSATFYNSVVIYNEQKNQLQINQLAYGTGLGIEYPFRIPFIGDMKTGMAYFAAFKNKFETYNNQFLFSLSSEFSW